VFRDGEAVAHPSVAEPFASIGAIDGSFGPIDESCEWVYGKQRWKDGVGTRVPFAVGQPTPDERAAQWAARRLERFADEGGDEPFFMGIGFIRPHTPMHAPPEFFDLFPIDEVELPPILLGDEDDTHYREHYRPSVKGLRYHRTIAEAYGSREAGLREFTRAYLASTAFVDAQIGVVLDAIDASPFAENTIVIITSDHGFGIGEKAYLFKNALWEESSRVPMLIRAPGVSVAGGRARSPVSLIDLFPTLVDLCDLEGDTRLNDKGRPLDGFSLRPLLEDPAAGAWSGPEASLTMLHADEEAAQPLAEGDYNDPTRQHWSLRSADWRYIRYNDGLEELYDHRTDPHEWHNIADDPASAAVLARFRAMLERRVGVNTGE
jgi:arylsulfatase A-like enzyme